MAMTQLIRILGVRKVVKIIIIFRATISVNHHKNPMNWLLSQYYR